MFLSKWSTCRDYTRQLKEESKEKEILLKQESNKTSKALATAPTSLKDTLFNKSMKKSETLMERRIQRLPWGEHNNQGDLILRWMLVAGEQTVKQSTSTKRPYNQNDNEQGDNNKE